MDCIELATKLGIRKSSTEHKYFCFNKNAHKNEDKNPSLMIYPESFTCCACGIKGNNIELFKLFTGKTVPEYYEYIGESTKKNKKLHIRFINKSATSRFIALNKDEVKVRNPEECDIQTIRNELGKKFSLDTLNRAKIKISVSPYGLVCGHAGEQLFYNPYEKDTILHCEGRTDYLTAIELGLYENYGLVSDFNKQSVPNLKSGKVHIFCLDDDDTPENKIKTISKTNILNKKFKFLRLPSSYKDLSDYYNIGDCNKDDIVKLISQTEENTLQDKSLINFTYHTGRGLAINYKKYAQFLTSLGIYKYITPEMTQIFLKQNGFLIEELPEFQIKNLVLDHYDDLPDDVQNFLYSKSQQLFSESQLTNIKVKDFELKKSDEKRDFKYFRNCYLEITANEVKVHSYDDLDGYIWKSKIINRDFHLEENVDKINNFDFSRFVSNVMNKDEKRILSIKTAIGYLLHSFKTPSLSKAIVFVDEESSASESGGTGKSLVADSLQYFNPAYVHLDGKAFDSKDRFCFQTLNRSTEIVNFDDIDRNFNFTRLFASLTDGYQIEKKTAIPFKNKNIKTVISTNYSIKGTGDSFYRRREEYEFAKYYSKGHRPIDEFGRNLFFDWNEEDWNLFDNYMILAIQAFLKHGLISSPSNNLEHKRFVDSVPDTFYDFISTQKFVVNFEYSYNTLFEQFKPTDDSNMKKNSFWKYLQIYAQYKGLNLTFRRSNGDKIITLRTLEEPVVVEQKQSEMDIQAEQQIQEIEVIYENLQENEETLIKKENEELDRSYFNGKIKCLDCKRPLTYYIDKTTIPKAICIECKKIYVAHYLVDKYRDTHIFYETSPNVSNEDKHLISIPLTESFKITDELSASDIEAFRAAYSNGIFNIRKYKGDLMIMSKILSKYKLLL